jgi:hypothetical protein
MLAPYKCYTENPTLIRIFLLLIRGLPTVANGANGANGAKMLCNVTTGLRAWVTCESPQSKC